jgi:hypothetical protein
MSKGLTGLIAFTVSAVFHELVIALPLKSTHMPLAFLAMMAQVGRMRPPSHFAAARGRHCIPAQGRDSPPSAADCSALP